MSAPQPEPLPRRDPGATFRPQPPAVTQKPKPVPPKPKGG